MRYLIDGFNVLYKAQAALGLTDSKEAVWDLMRLLASRKNRGRSYIVFLDGAPIARLKAAFQGVVEIHFSYESTADERIVSFLKKEANRRGAVVVSDDNEVKYNAKALGAQTMSVMDFIAALIYNAKKNKAQGQKDLSPQARNEITKELERLWIREQER